MGADGVAGSKNKSNQKYKFKLILIIWPNDLLVLTETANLLAICNLLSPIVLDY